MIDEIAALLLQAMTQACEERGDGIVTAQDDDLTAVEIEGTFDLRGLALTVLGAMPKSKGEASVTAMVSIADDVSDASVQRINDTVDAITAALK